LFPALVRKLHASRAGASSSNFYSATQRLAGFRNVDPAIDPRGAGASRP
jgi:hypothetical protein